jgi:hypothetical protein
MANLRLIKREHTLVYGMRLFADRVLPEGEHDRVPLRQAGENETLTLHVITGDRAEIKRRLLQSVDAFFDIYAEDLP